MSITTNLGRVGFVIQGAYVNGQAYLYLDVVTWGSTTYVCANVNGSSNPPSNTTDWVVLCYSIVTAGNGTQLAIGQTGAQGSTGATGATGKTTPQTRFMNFQGSVTAQTGTVKFYPPVPITIQSVVLAMGGISASNTLVMVNKNGTALLGSAIVLPATNPVVTLTGLSINVLSTDYLTVDITAAGTDGLNLAVAISFIAT
jgi:hypothetical protein